MEENIDLNKKDAITNNMVNEQKEKEKDTIDKTNEEDVSTEPRNTKKTKRKQKRENKKAMREAKKEKKEADKNIKVIIDGKEHMLPKTMVADYSKKEYKIQDDSKKIANGEVAILYLRESNIAELRYVKPYNGMFIIDGRYYHINASCFFSIGKKRIPLAIIPEWSFVPISKKEYEVILGAKYQDAQMLIIKSLENAEIVKIQQEGDVKGKADSKLIVGILIAAVVGLFFLNKMFGSG